MPNTHRCCLRYETGGTSQSLIAGTNRVVIRGNSLYDPEHAVGGHQPMGFDQLIALYNRFRVTASYIEAKVTANTATTGAEVRCYLLPCRDSSPANEFYWENEGCVSDICGVSGLAKTAILKNYCASTKMIGYPLDPVSSAGDAGADPTDAWYWILQMVDIDSGNSETVYNYDILVKYYVEFFDPKDFGSS